MSSSQTGTQAGAWHVLRHIEAADGGYPRATQMSGAAGQPDRRDAFTVRISPSGSSLPFALELQAGQLRRLLWTDGVTGRIRFRDGMRLSHFSWVGPEVVTP